MRVIPLIVGSLATNCYLLISANRLVIVDPGADKEKILKKIEHSHADTIYIINTHYHPDHSKLDLELKQILSAEILIHKAEKQYIDFEADRWLKDEDTIKIGQENLKVIHTPGHSPGGICLLANDFILTGDTLFKNGRGRTDFPGGSESEMQASLKLLSRIIKPGMKVYPGHGESFIY